MKKRIVINHPDQVNLAYQKSVYRNVLEICKPIFDYFEITFFSHTRAFHDGGFTCLLSYTELTEYYLQQKYPVIFSHGKGLLLETGFYIANHMANTTSDKIRRQLREKFNKDHFVYIIDKDKQNNYDDMYAFATTPENDCVINRYLNNRELLNHFILYYKDKSAQLIKKADTVIYSNDYFINHNHSACPNLHLNKHVQENCIKSMPINKFYITGNAGEVTVSKREFECLQYIVKNYTLKEIGKHLHLSPRTVETYLNNLKSKLNCEKRSQLITIVEQLSDK